MYTTQIHSVQGISHIHIANGALAQLGEIAAQAVQGHNTVVVSDGNVCNLHLEPALKSLREAGFTAEQISVPAGEASKSIQMVTTLWNAFCGYGLTRTDVIIALGGGVVGDLTGFAAATYLRGIPIIQVPTSLLAQVDSSIGGKTGIDLKFGKNLAGAFHQPKATVIDPLVLSTLPPKRFTEGMAEVVKYGCIYDAHLFEQLEHYANNTADRDELLSIIKRCVQLKVDVVNRDEHDTGDRMILNFGHTVGHAIENVMGYGYISHGEAVAIGMVIAAQLGESIGETESGTATRIHALLTQLGLPTTTEFTAQEIFPLLLNDKKKLGKDIHFILLKKLGEAFRLPLSPEALRTALAPILNA